MMLYKSKIESAQDVAQAFEVEHNNDNAPIFDRLSNFFIFGDANLRNDIDYNLVLVAAWKIYEAAMVFNWHLSDETLAKIDAWGNRHFEDTGRSLGLEENLLLNFDDFEDGQASILNACHAYFEIDRTLVRNLAGWLTKQMVEAQGVFVWSQVELWISLYADILDVVSTVADYCKSGKNQFRFGV